MKKRWITYIIFIVLMILIAVGGGVWTKKKKAPAGGERCVVDNTPINPVYEVKAFLMDQSVKKFCSIPCAQHWQRENKEKILYITVVDEKTGQSLDSSLAFFVESERVNVPQVKSRIHVFSNKADAIAHANSYKGRFIDNPFGTSFIPSTSFEKVNVGILPWIDALPLHLATIKPIFKENRLEVKLFSFPNEKEMGDALLNGNVDAIVTDLPYGILLNQGGKRFSVVRTIMRTNPRRPLYALMSLSNDHMKTSHAKGKRVAITGDLNVRFIAEMLLYGEGVSPEDVSWMIKEDMGSVLKSLIERSSDMAFLREPFVTYAKIKKANVLLDDTLKALGLSVLLFSKEFIDRKAEAVRKLLY